MEQVLSKIAQIAEENNIEGYPECLSGSMDIVFYQNIGSIKTPTFIPAREIEDRAWPIIEARLKFYGKCSPCCGRK